MNFKEPLELSDFIMLKKIFQQTLKFLSNLSMMTWARLKSNLKQRCPEPFEIQETSLSNKLSKKDQQILHTLCLSRLLAYTKIRSGFCSRNGEIKKAVANLRRLKSLRCLNVDLCWLLTLRKGHVQFAESLKHLKKLSVIHFYVAEENVTLSNIPHLYQNLCKVPIVPKAEVQLSFLDYFGLAERSFGKLLRV